MSTSDAERYDYIIAGAGSSGLSLAWHMIHSDLRDSRILVVDEDLEPENDKTWCFWSSRDDIFEFLVCKRWNLADVFVNGRQYRGTLAKYPYRCIQSGDYRAKILEKLQTHKSVDLIEAPVKNLEGAGTRALLKTDEQVFEADYIFQSCFSPSLSRAPRYPLIQHFLGWEVTARNGPFDPHSLTLMDFDESYRAGIAFMYVLPWSEQRALLEYTIFSTAVEAGKEYEEKLELYLYNRYKLRRIDYSIDRIEQGAIPMEDSVYNSWFAPRVLNIGLGGGLTKPSTGYTYRRIQEHSKQIVRSLQNNGRPTIPSRSSFRYRSYDLWLLQIMHDYPEDAFKIFHALFKNNSFDDVFRFLGEESTLAEDLKIMASVPHKPFFRAIWKTGWPIFNF